MMVSNRHNKDGSGFTVSLDIDTGQFEATVRVPPYVTVHKSWPIGSITRDRAVLWCEREMEATQ